MKEKIKKYAFALLALTAVLPGPAAASTVRGITPYVGTVSNSNAAFHLKDSGGIYAISAYWLNTDKFQISGIYYRIPELNYSEVTSLNLTFDYYLRPSKAGKWVAGGGLEDQNTDVSAGRNIYPYTSFEMEQDVLFYYLRAGRYFYYKNGFLDASVLPYAGYVHEKITGQLRVNVASISDIEESDSHPMAGLNLSATLARYIGLQVNWMGRFKDEARVDEYTLIASLYFNRHWGLSCRHKYRTDGSSFISYTLASIAYRF